MKKLKKMLSVILITTMLLSTFSIGITAYAEITRQAEGSPFSIEVTTNKSEYGALGIAKINVRITNTTDESIENVSAEAVFDSLSPLGKGDIKAETDILESGQSIEFSYKVTLKKDFAGLNGLQKFFLAFKRMFYKKVSVGDNGFDNGRACIEKSTPIKFGKYEVENIVRVWYATDNEILQIYETNLKISELVESEQYKNIISDSKKVESLKNCLVQLSNLGLIEKDSVEYIPNENMVCFEYACGIESFISINNHNSQYADSSFSYNASKKKLKKILLKENKNENISDKVFISYGWGTDGDFQGNYEVSRKVNEEINSLGYITNFDESMTVEKYKNSLSDNDIILIQQHGVVYETKKGGRIYGIIIDEKNLSLSKLNIYKDDIKEKRIILGWNQFILTPSFFRYHYSNAKLKNSIILLDVCNSFGRSDDENGISYELSSSFRYCGASTVIGFHNSVSTEYATFLSLQIINDMKYGKSVGQAFEDAIDKYGKTDYEYWIEWRQTERDIPEFGFAFPVLDGDRSKRLNSIENNQGSYYGKLTDSGNCSDNISWEYYGETGTLVITGNGTLDSANWSSYKEEIKKIIINGDITKIASWLFAGYNNLIEVQLPYGIKVISKYSFSSCISLKSISFPDGLIEIGDEAFNGCSSIESIILPNSLKTLGGRAFGGCSNAKELSIGNGLTELPFSAFSDNTSLKSVIIPDNITSLGIYVFSGCKMLKNVTIGDGITVISAWAFQDCTNLQEVNFGKKICSTQQSAFGNCTNLEHIVLNDNFKELGQGTFGNCIALKTISIPVSVTAFSPYVFSGCHSLSDIFYKGSQAEWESITKGGDYGNTDEILNHVTIHYNSK